MYIQKVLGLLHHFRNLFRESSLFRNSIYLMGSTIVMSVMGFGFWVFVAHLYTPSDIGNASALISLSALITNFSMLGINASLVRFLARSKNQSSMVNAAIIIVGAATVLASLIYLIIGSQFSATARIFIASPIHMVLFAAIMAMVSINSLTDAVFIANRRAEFHTIAYGVLGLVRLIAPLFLIMYGSWGIFASYIVATTVSLIVSFALMKRTNGYALFTRPDWSVIRKARTYAVNNYIGVLLAGIPAQIMPLLIIQNLSAASAAFYSMAWTMSNLLWVIPSAMAQSLLAESSSDQEGSSRHIRETVRMLTLILVPVITVSIFVAPFLLSIFGSEYSHGSTLLFQLFAFGTVFVALNSIGNTILNIERRTSGIIVTQLATLIVTLGSVALLWRFGLLGVGVATLLGMVASNLVHVWLYVRQRRKRARANRSATIPFAPTAGVIRRMVRPYDITGVTAKPLPNGSSNQTFLITAGDTKYVLRVYRENSRTMDQIRTEVNFMETLSANGIPVPAVLSTQTGSKISRITLSGVMYHYIIMSFEAGTHPESYSPELIKHMAVMQARIHQVGLSYSDTLNRSRLFNPARLVRRSLPVAYSHFDFDASNILTDDSRNIKSVLDFEGMRYGPLWVCLYFTLAQIYRADHDTAQIHRYLVEYQKQRPLTMLEARLTLLALALRHHTPTLLMLRTEPKPSYSY